MDKLNKKLAEWAELDVRYNDIRDKYYIVPNGIYKGNMPDFTQSLDACDKWLVPKLKAEGYNVRLYIYCNEDPDAFIDSYSKRSVDIVKRGKTPALALCLAIEKVIDNAK